MKRKNLSIDINLKEDSINPIFLALQKKLASNIFNKFNSFHEIKSIENYITEYTQNSYEVGQESE